MGKLKYMGTADVRQLEKGWDGNGQLSEGISKDVQWSKENNWVVDTDDAGLSAEAVEVLTGDPDFKEVGDSKKIPLNAHQKTFLSMKSSEDPDEVFDGEEPTASGQDKATEDAAKPSGTSESPGTTVGGSTKRRGGGATT